MKRIMIVPDLQIPYHDKRATKAVIRYIADTQPDEVVLIGDVLDFPQPSRWNKDTRGEFEGSIYRDVETAKRELFGPLRDGYSGPIGFHEGNHDERPRVYLDKYSPALSGTDAFSIRTLCELDNFGIDVLPEFNDIAPGWVSTHGHRGGFGITSVGSTAIKAANKFGKSVVMGHTHRLNIISVTTGYGGIPNRTVTGFEVGNLMDMKQAQYLKGGTANWQQGFGILDVDGKTVNPIPVRIQGKRFIADGETWEI